MARHTLVISGTRDADVALLRSALLNLVATVQLDHSTTVDLYEDGELLQRRQTTR